MRRAPTILRPPRPAPAPRADRRRVLRAAAAAAVSLSGVATAVHADPAAVESLELLRGDDGLMLGFAVRFELSRPVEDALLKGVPLHFTAVAAVYRNRWYWTDRRIATAMRSWRLSYQPLTRQFRVSFGGLNQSFDTLEEAIASASRAVNWRILEPGALEDGARHYVEFSYRLDTSLLPRPLQIGIVGQPDWTLELRRTERLG